MWMAHVKQLGRSAPKNTFSPEMRQFLREEGLIDHSAFYAQTQIAGYTVTQPAPNGKETRNFIILIPELFEVRAVGP